MKPKPTKRSAIAPTLERKFFIVKHGLDAFELLPNYIWVTDYGPRKVPQRYPSIKKGDRWIAYAYTTGDEREAPLSLITGFYECTDEAQYGDIPARALAACDGVRKAWMIKGREYGRQPRWPVEVLSIRELLNGRNIWQQESITPITGDEFEKIGETVFERELDPRRIPLLRRQPDCEQEVLSIVVAARTQLGIKEIIRVRTRFPDLLVNIGGIKVWLELELYSQHFEDHGHVEQLVTIRRDEGYPVAVLCWLDNAKNCKWRKKVTVYELQSLLREGKKIKLRSKCGRLLE